MLRTYASKIHKSSLRKFSQKQGYGDEYIGLWFKEDLEEDPYAFQEELAKIKDDQVIFNVTPVGGPEREPNLYLDFDEFYAYLVPEVLRSIKESPEDKEEYVKLLGDVKKRSDLVKTSETYCNNEITCFSR